MKFIILSIFIMLLGNLKAQASFKLTDKDEHFLVNSNIGTSMGIAIYKMTDKPGLSIILTTLIMTGINIGKEIRDKYSGGIFNPKDIVAGSKGLVTADFIIGGSIVLKLHREVKIKDLKKDLL